MDRLREVIAANPKRSDEEVLAIFMDKNPTSLRTAKEYLNVIRIVAAVEHPEQPPETVP
jgi:hypothetical protein